MSPELLRKKRGAGTLDPHGYGCPYLLVLFTKSLDEISLDAHGYAAPILRGDYP
jgi:hypothetical protein